MSSIRALRLTPLLATLVALGAGLGANAARASAGSEALEAAPPELEARIEALIQRWFALLGDSTAEASSLSELLAEPPFELLIDGRVLRDRSELLAWASALRATYPQIEYQLDPIEIHAESKGLHRAAFEFDRRALDNAGLSHVARRKHTWIVQSDPHARPVILRIEEQPLLFFPGTGPQIICY